ncbi:MAG: hypothetical protein ACKVU4_09155 [Phycisphaerales bacterium]
MKTLLSRGVRTAAIVLVAGAALWSAGEAAAWNAHGHRVITRLALEGLPADAPAWVRDPVFAGMIAEESVEPDRWRGTRMPPLGHENGPDHYLDVELLDQFGLTLASVPKYRYDYLRVMAIAKHEHPERVEPYDLGDDDQRQYEWPGFAAHAMTEHYAKLRSSFHTWRVLEAIVKDDPSQRETRAAQIELARLNAIYHMGVLSHFVGDMSQPLHATKHHHGWVGENPDGFTADRGFHAYVDGRILEIHSLDVDGLRAGMSYDVRVNAADPWEDVIRYVGATFENVRPLYELQKSGDLEKEPGKALIEARLRAGGAMLAALYTAAWENSAPTDQDVASFIRFSPPERTEPAGGRGVQPGR